MKARFVKSIMCLTLAGALVAGEVGTVFAAEPAIVQETAENTQKAEVSEAVETEKVEETEAPVETEMPEVEVPQETENVSEAVEITEVIEEAEEPAVNEVVEEVKEPEETEEPEAADGQEQVLVQEETELPKVKMVEETQEAPSVGTLTPSITYSYSNTSSYSRQQYISFSGYGSKFEIYVNNVKWNTLYNNETADANDPAPWYSDSFEFTNMIPGVNYTFKIVPYSYDGTTEKAGTAKIFTGKINLPTVSSVTASVYGTTVYENGTTTGYRKPYVSLNCNISNYNYSYYQKYEIYRAVGKKTASYKKVAETSSSGSSVWWSDYDIKVGTKYYYKVRAVSDTDTYAAKTVAGSFSKVCEASVSKPAADCGVSYEDGIVSVYAEGYGFSSGFDVYRSTKKTKGYKKIATISDTSYQDKKVKSGSAYYYKVKPFYYDTKTKRKYSGEYSDPAGVKVLMGSIYLETQQTASNKVKLSWNKVAGAKNYDIYYKTDMAGDAYKRLGSTKKLSYTAKLSANTGYSFQIRACSESGNVKSYYQSASNYINLGFKAPENFRVAKKSISVKSTSLTIKSTLRWDRVYGAKSYRIEAYDNYAQQTKTIKTLKSSATSYTLNNTALKGKGAKYSSVRIYAVNGNKERSSYLSEYQEGNKYGTVSSLAAVSGVKAKRSSSTSVKIAWKKVAGADNYTIYRQAPTGERVYLGKTSKTSFTDKKLTPGVNYTYSIVASNEKFGIFGSDDYGLLTNAVVYKHKLGATSITSVKNVSGKKAVITWKKAAYAQQYVVYRADSKNGTYKKVATVKGKTSYTNSKLSKGKTYYYRVEVRTVNDAGITVASAKSGYKAVKIKK